jgi:hypothetical protein
MTQRITLSIKPEKRRMLERLAKKRQTTMSGILDELLEKEARSEDNSGQKPLLGDMLASLTLKDEFKHAKSPQEVLAILRERKAARQ